MNCYDFQCEKCEKIQEIFTHGCEVHTWTCDCGGSMKRLPVGVKAYSWGAGDNSASVTPKKFRREGQK